MVELLAMKRMKQYTSKQAKFVLSCSLLNNPGKHYAAAVGQ